VSNGRVSTITTVTSQPLRSEEARVLRSALSGLGQRVFDAENTLANVRDWADRTGHYVPGQITDWQRGFLTARREVRQLLDGTDE
jgi:hypothetical protein